MVAASPHAAPNEHECEAALWRDYAHTRDAAVRTRLFELHSGFARGLARRMHARRSRGDIDAADLVQQAGVALLEAIDRFDPAQGVPFRAFAARRLLGSMADAIRRTSDLREQQSTAARIRRERVRALAPAAGTGLSADSALDAAAELAIGLAIGFMLEDAADDPTGAGDAYHSASWRELVLRTTQELDRLPERERLILSEHYLRGVAFDTLAALLSLTKGRISQLHRAALATLRKRLGTHGHFSLRN